MIQRFIAATILVWLIGFLVFAVTLPGPAAAGAATAAVVPTGAAGRIKRGVELLSEKQVDQLFVSGVDPDVTAEEFAIEFEVNRGLMNCCVSLGFEATDTRGNAVEIANWANRQEIDSVRLVTSDWHMHRAAGELERKLPDNV